MTSYLIAGVIEECRAKAAAANAERKPRNWYSAFIIITIWVIVAALIVRAFAQPT